MPIEGSNFPFVLSNIFFDVLNTLIKYLFEFKRGIDENSKVVFIYDYY